MDNALKIAERGISYYLDTELSQGRIDKAFYDVAMNNVIKKMTEWLNDPYTDNFSKKLKAGIISAVEKKEWGNICEAFFQDIKFGTAGIRGKMAYDKDSIIKMKENGVDCEILKGPNTYNDKVLLLIAVGIARYMRDNSQKKIVIGYDSRIRGSDFAHLIAKLFLAYEIEVYIFDEPCMYPEVTFAMPHMKADIGIFISASHNDYRYNGFKFSCPNGSQFLQQDRDKIYNDYIQTSNTSQIKFLEFEDAAKGQINFLGGSEPLKNYDYKGKHDMLIDIHTPHINHCKNFILRHDVIERQRKNPLLIGYSAFNGSGRKSVPRLLKESGFLAIKKIDKLDPLDGLFPAFCSDPGKEQQPDPGDDRAAKIAVEEFKKQYPGEFEKTDIIIGTDPDADRCGIIVRVPEAQRGIYNDDHYLLPADYLWALLMWYRIQSEKHNNKKFVVLSNITTDAITLLARKNNIGVVKTWVGFTWLSNAVNMAWKGIDFPILQEGRNKGSDLCHPLIYSHEAMNKTRTMNVGAMEQSNGFSILGDIPEDDRSMGTNGHVRDKDGTLAALLVAEVAAYARENNTNLIDLIDEKIFLDPDIGLFANKYIPAPLDGEYEGLEGYSIKKRVINNVLELHNKFINGKNIFLGGRKVEKSYVYRTGKYDSQNWKGFPDEGVRFYFGTDYDWITFRPSGTSNALRFHVQLRDNTVNKQNLLSRKKELNMEADEIIKEIMQITGAI